MDTSMINKVKYSFSIEQTALAEKVVADLMKRLLRDYELQPAAALWSDNPNLIVDVQKLHTQLSKQTTEVAIEEIIAKMFKRNIEHLIDVIRDLKALESKFGTERQMRSLYILISGELTK